VVRTLELIVGAAFHGCAVFVYLVIFGVDVGHLVISLSSIMVALTLIFGNFLRTIFEGVVFLFMVHPYDVGEVLSWGDELHVVNEIGLLNTVLLKWDGRKIFVRRECRVEGWGSRAWSGRARQRALHNTHTVASPSAPNRPPRPPRCPTPS